LLADLSGKSDKDDPDFRLAGDAAPAGLTNVGDRDGDLVTRVAGNTTELPPRRQVRASELNHQ
jgi:hypothetical protein